MSEQFFEVVLEDSSGNLVDSDTLTPGTYRFTVKNISGKTIGVTLNKQSLGLFQPGEWGTFQSDLSTGVEWIFSAYTGLWAIRGNFVPLEGVIQVSSFMANGQ